jgi:hypothetical protein
VREAIADHAERVLELRTQKRDSDYDDHGNERENECIFRETLSFLAMKDQLHSASFRRRRLAFVATSGGGLSDTRAILTAPGVTSA